MGALRFTIKLTARAGQTPASRANTGHLFGRLAKTAESGETIIAGNPSAAVRTMLACGGHAPPPIYLPL